MPITLRSHSTIKKTVASFHTFASICTLSINWSWGKALNHKDSLINVRRLLQNTIYFVVISPALWYSLERRTGLKSHLRQPQVHHPLWPFVNKLQIGKPENG